MSAQYPHSGLLHVLFYLGLSLLVCHELDAVARAEWRFLPLLNQLNDEQGQIAFVLGHIPPFVLMFWLAGHQNDIVRLRSQMVVDGILIVHGVLHYLLSDSPLYEFKPPVETVTIYGGALIGLLHLVLMLTSNNRMRRMPQSSTVNSTPNRSC